MDKPRWTREEIDKTVEILSRAKQKKSKLIRFLDEVVYLTVFVAALIINFIVSLALIPVLIVFSGIYLYITVGVLAICFGLLFEILVRDIESLETRHHVINSLIIPAIAIINLIAIGFAADYIAEFFKLGETHQNPLIVGVIYAFFFILPYIHYHFYKKR